MSDILMQVRQDAGVVELAKQRVYTVEEIDAYDRALIAATRRAVLEGVTHYHTLQTQPHRVCVDFATPEQADAFAALLDTQLAGGDE